MSATSVPAMNSDVELDIRREAKINRFAEMIPQFKLARLLNKPREGMEAWFRQGFGPPRYKLGGRVFYKIAEVEKWIEESRQTPPRKKSGGRRA